MTDRAVLALPSTLDTGIAERGRLGLIVLESDQTLETELRTLPLPGVAIHHSRIANDLHVSPETLLAMKERIPASAALLPPAFEFDAIGYGCTSASTLIGDQAITDAVRTSHPDVPVTNPIRAAIAAFGALGATRVGVVTPYTEEITVPVIERFERDGLDVPAFGSFLIDNDLDVARISPASVEQGLDTVAAAAPCDALFVSCTSVRLFADVARLEDRLGVPVVSSNLALAWHLIRLAGIDDRFTGFGSLFAQA